MQAIEFQPSLKNGQIEAELEEEKAWKKLAAESFLNGYSEADSVYDNRPIDENEPENLFNDIIK